MTEVPVSVVIATHDRCASCVEAVESVLSQDPRPLEVIVCDDGSTDATQAQLQGWARRERRLRYMRIEPSRGGPGPARNLGLSHATGEWVAFLDDDDRWLSGKLAAQGAFMGSADVIAANADRSSGGCYFPDLKKPLWVNRRDVLAINPFIVSSTLARRSLIVEAGGFREEKWLGAIADYALWLELMDLGARAVILPQPLVLYDDSGDSRMSDKVVKLEVAIARMAWLRWLRSPLDQLAFRAAVNKTIAALRVARDQLGRQALGRKINAI
jgi:glycosyltransferase involved in cell wall biosynthesis